MTFLSFPLPTIWTDTAVAASTDPTRCTSCRPVRKVVERCLLMTTDPGDLVLDPTCGSGTTAYVAEQWGRRWITIDTSRVALALARTRLMAAKFPVLPAGRLARGHQEGSRADRQDAAARTRPKSDIRRASSTSACRTSRSNRSPTTRTSRKA